MEDLEFIRKNWKLLNDKQKSILKLVGVEENGRKQTAKDNI